VVPDASLREITRIGRAGRAGRALPVLSAAIAGSFHLVMVPLKMLAAVGPSRFSDVTPPRRNPMAIGPKTIGRFHTGAPQRCWARSYSPLLSGESDPPKSVCSDMNSSMPAPEPFGWYVRVWPGQALLNVATNRVIALV